MPTVELGSGEVTAELVAELQSEIGALLVGGDQCRNSDLRPLEDPTVSPFSELKSFPQPVQINRKVDPSP